ncbi:MAG: LysR family transcriptional regulator [Planctomycetota bacterium]|jgi:DNA-binding transcriptional LysR family regulator
MIQIHRLEGFYWVAKAGGYARAARAFPYPITQPAVHQQVKKLSEELEMELFERVGKDRMMLTPAGLRLYEFIAPFYEGLGSVIRAVKAGEQSGELHIHAETMMLHRLLPRWLKRLQKRCPQVKIELREVASTDLEPLRSGEADLLVGYVPELPNDVAALEVARLRGFFIVPADHPKAGRARLQPKDLGSDPFIAYHQGLIAHDLQMQALSMHGIAPKNTIFAGSAENIIAFVESGLGYSLVPSMDAAGPKSKHLRAIPLNRPKIDFPVYAVWRKDAPENAMLDAALDTAPQVAG